MVKFATPPQKKRRSLTPTVAIYAAENLSLGSKLVKILPNAGLKCCVFWLSAGLINHRNKDLQNKFFFHVAMVTEVTFYPRPSFFTPIFSNIS